jgi:hypothetical protein
MPPTKRAQSAPVKALRAYDEDYLLCRNLGHVWSVVGYYRAPDGITARLLTCDRCETERTDRWTARTGERHQGRYRYAGSYQMGGFDGDRASATDVRVEVMRRATVYANEESMLASVMKGRK